MAVIRLVPFTAYVVSHGIQEYLLHGRVKIQNIAVRACVRGRMSVYAPSELDGSRKGNMVELQSSFHFP